MLPESSLLESRTMRESLSARTEVLDKVKVLEVLPDGLHVTTDGVADYFKVTRQAVENLVVRHREELESNGLHVLRGSDLREFETFNLNVSNGAPGSYPQRRRRLTLWPRRAVLNVAMLLRDSEVARRVRTYLLDAEETHRARERYGRERASEPWEWYEPGFDDLRPLLVRTHRMVSAINVELCAVRTDVRRLDERMDRFETRMDRLETRMTGVETRVDGLAAHIRRGGRR
ncbi:hypothetical protein ACFQLX_07495 [Streptomyces polyrhachis]|uniref:Uncharacterized protein n=1 Tax=Streptomyces polyrhachis TaxID=1282885 RepID=A0ABW2GFC8_9ACTN